MAEREWSGAAVQGVSGNGTWVVEARDMSASDAGTITLVSLMITTGEAFATSGSDGAYSLTQLEAGAHSIRATAASGYASTQAGGLAVNIGDVSVLQGTVSLGSMMLLTGLSVAPTGVLATGANVCWWTMREYRRWGG